MYVVVQHQFTNPEVALTRGEQLIKNEGTPEDVRGLQFYQDRDSPLRRVSGRPTQSTTCSHVVGVLSATSHNFCYEVNAEQ